MKKIVLIMTAALIIQLPTIASAKVEIKQIIIENTYNDDITVEESVNNCEGNSPQKTIEVSLTNSEALTVTGRQTVTAGGSVNVYGVELNISSAITQEVTRQYGSTISLKDTLQLNANPGKTIIHKIRHARTYAKGYVEVEKTEYFFFTDTEKIPFTYCISYRLIKEGERQGESCPRPQLSFLNYTIQPGSPCQNNFKTYNSMVEVKNSGNRLADRVRIYMRIKSLGTNTERSFDLVQGGYIPAGNSAKYQRIASLPCNDFPRNTDVRINFFVDFTDPISNQHIIHDQKQMTYRLPY